MDPFWRNIYDDDKDKRYGGLFFGILLLFFVGLSLFAAGISVTGKMVPDFLVGLTGEAKLNRFVTVCLVLAGAVSIVAIVLFMRRRARFGRKAHEDRLKYSNLSRDELMKARSKLKNQMNPVKFRAVERPGKRPALRAPDTDIKY